MKRHKAKDQNPTKLEEDVEIDQKVLKKCTFGSPALLFWLLSAVIISASFITGFYFGQNNSAQDESTTDSRIIAIDEKWNAFPATHIGYLSQEERAKEANRLLEKASKFSGEEGEGRQGWLHLLAAYSYDKSHRHILSNLVDNYRAVNYDHLAYSTMIESGLDEKEQWALMKSDVPKFKRYFHDLREILLTKGEQLDPGQGSSSILFPTVVSKWNLNSIIKNPKFNQEVYDLSVGAYLEMKKQNPQKSPTDLNHQFFRVQMSDLDNSHSYWAPLTKIEGFTDLVLMMRFAAVRFLRDNHGWDEEAAIRKASHSLIVWISVHTEVSTHQPHVTEDALVGGVYYVSVPEGSGVLDLFDPRGKHPVTGLANPVSPPDPPFHRTHSLVPQEGNLVLFPGWLVHSVRTPSKEQRSNFHGRYRVSMSLNLKGEWIDTSNNAFGSRTDVL